MCSIWYNNVCYVLYSTDVIMLRLFEIYIIIIEKYLIVLRRYGKKLTRIIKKNTAMYSDYINEFYVSVFSKEVRYSKHYISLLLSTP